MRWCLSVPGSAKYILPVTLSTSVSPVSPHDHPRSLKMYWIECIWDALGEGDRVNSEMHLEAMIERVGICTWRLGLSELRDALGSRNRATLEMHWEAIIERIWRYTWRPWLSVLRDALWDYDRARLEMHLWRPWSSDFGDSLGGREGVSLEICTSRPWSCELAGSHRASLEIRLEAEIACTQKMHLEAGINRVWRCTCRLRSSEIGGVHGGDRFWGRHDGSWDSIHWLTCNCGNVESWVQHPPRDEKLAGSGSLSILGWCCTRCMLYSVLTHDDGMER